jgi:ABC-2 type transport system permease protein
MKLLGVLLRQRGRLLWNRVTRGPRRAWRLASATLAVFFTLSFVTFAGLNAGFFVERIARIDRVVAVQTIPVVLGGVVVLTLVTSLSSAFHHLFLASDLELLLATPVPARSLFGLKVFEIWRDSLHIILFQAGALYGFGQSLHLPPSYYVTAICVGLLLTLCASALGATLTLGLARVPFGQSILMASRLLAVLLFLPVGVLGVPALGFGRNRISLLSSQATANTVVDQLRRVGDPPTWLPTTWAAHVLLADEDAMLSVALLVATAIVLFGAMQLAFDHLFQVGWEGVRFSGPARSRVQWRQSVWRPPMLEVSRGAISGLLMKDWRTLIRDPRWRNGTLFSLVALVLPATVLFVGDPFARSPHVMRFWFSMLPVPYLAYLFGSQQGASTLIYEGRNLALLRAAPVGLGRVIIAKVVGGLVLVLLATWAATMAVGLTHAGEPLEIAAALLVATWLAIGATLSAVAVAALTADFESDNPQRRIGCLGTILISGLSLCFFASNIAVMLWWIARSVFSIPRLLLAIAPLLDWGLPILVLLSVVGIVLVARLGFARLATYEIS